MDEVCENCFDLVLNDGTFLFDDNYVLDQFRELVDYLRVQRECDGKFEDGELFVAAKFPEGLLQVAVGDSCGDEADVMLLAVGIEDFV